MKYKGLTIHYAAIYAFLFMLICGTGGYTNNYLLYRGFSPSTIGIILTCISILTLVFQTGLAPIIDRSSKLDEKKTLLLTMGAATVCYALMIVVPMGSALIIPLVIVGMSAAMMGMPFLNTIAFLYEKEGQTINFGLCRGIGSLAYALGGQVIGRLLAWKTEKILPVYLLVMVLISLAAVATLRVPAREAKSGEAKVEEKQISYGEFFRKYKKLIPACAALILLFFAHMLLNNYMINVLMEIGGTTADQGNVIFLQAVVELPPMFLFAWIMKKVKINKLMIISACAFALKHILMVLASNMVIFYMSCVLQMFAYALLAPTIVYFATENVGEEDRNKGQAIVNATSTVGGLFASFLGGILLTAVGVHTTLTISAGATVLGAVMMIMAIRSLEKAD